MKTKFFIISFILSAFIFSCKDNSQTEIVDTEPISVQVQEKLKDSIIIELALGRFSGIYQTISTNHFNNDKPNLLIKLDTISNEEINVNNDFVFFHPLKLNVNGTNANLSFYDSVIQSNMLRTCYAYGYINIDFDSSRTIIKEMDFIYTTKVVSSNDSSSNTFTSDIAFKNMPISIYNKEINGILSGNSFAPNIKTFNYSQSSTRKRNNVWDTTNMRLIKAYNFDANANCYLKIH